MSGFVFRANWISWCGCLLAVAALSGCSGKGKEPTVDKGNSLGNFRLIERAYLAAIQKYGRPPKSREELVAFLPPDTDAEAVFRSPRDKKPVVIVWGTNLDQGVIDGKPLVYGYEKVGKDGIRMVLTAVGAYEMTDKEFTEAKFPQGHTP